MAEDDKKPGETAPKSQEQQPAKDSAFPIDIKLILPNAEHGGRAAQPPRSCFIAIVKKIRSRDTFL